MSHLNATPAVFAFARYFTRPRCPECNHEQFVPERCSLMLRCRHFGLPLSVRLLSPPRW